MYLISVPTFLEETMLRPHQHLAKENKLVKYDKYHAGRVIFVSHQWLAWNEPDPQGVHLTTLQALLRRLMEGDFSAITSDIIGQFWMGDSIKLKADQLRSAVPHMFLLIDYVSMPQNVVDDSIGQREDGMNAILSIPSYIERTSLILVLAPPTKHKDTHRICDFRSCGWRSRGWCRVEYAAAFFAHENRIPIIVARGRNSQPEFASPMDLYTLASEASSLAASEITSLALGQCPATRRRS
mmetsp:Transcript_22149/g.59525  ORF Transcript_22149/g.59525 Transcript_22149/m.59525 type:complete len:240 (-) Transcript_22149:758-1477(-)